ncbi:MAG: MFS transporter, partial [Alphaproteobacteria bacterium]|nr:MFS transporter [Alphaproteobacteria bacterium]
MAIMDAFIVNISLPSIRADLHASFGEAQLIIAAYGLVYAIGLITGGRLGDLYGRKRMFMIGLAAFTLTSLACGLAPTP